MRDITVEAWVKYYAGIQWAGPISFGGDDGSYERGVFLAQQDATADESKLTFAISTDGSADANGENGMTYLTSPPGDNSAVIDMNVWHHFAGTYDGTTAVLFVDGLRVASLAATDPGGQSGNINYPEISYAAGHGGWFTLGAYHDANEYYPINGLMDELRIWNVPLSLDEIAHSHCADGLTGTEAGLLHFWRMDEPDGLAVNNAVAGAQDGTIVGNVLRQPHEDLCLYGFEHGALDTSWGRIDSGHVSVPVTNILAQLPTREITVESWIKWYGGTDWAGPVSAAQDDGGTEKGFALSSRCGGDQGPPCDQGLTMAFAISTVGADDGDGVMTYVGCEDGATDNGGNGIRDPAAKVGSTPGAAAALGEWLHIAGVYDGAIATLYINGQEIVTSATSTRAQSGDILYPQVGGRGGYNAINGGWFTIGACKYTCTPHHNLFPGTPLTDCLCLQTTTPMSTTLRMVSLMRSAYGTSPGRRHISTSSSAMFYRTPSSTSLPRRV